MIVCGHSPLAHTSPTTRTRDDARGMQHRIAHSTQFEFTPSSIHTLFHPHPLPFTPSSVHTLFRAHRPPRMHMHMQRCGVNLSAPSGWVTPGRMRIDMHVDLLFFFTLHRCSAVSTNSTAYPHPCTPHPLTHLTHCVSSLKPFQQHPSRCSPCQVAAAVRVRREATVDFQQEPCVARPLRFVWRECCHAVA